MKIGDCVNDLGYLGGDYKATAFLYARYSSDQQSEYTIPAQLADMSKFCQEEKIRVKGIFIDEALTATYNIEKRDDFQNMINLIKNGIFVDYVIVHKIDRFARNEWDHIFYTQFLRDKGIRRLSVIEKIPDTPEGKMMERFLEGMSAYYSANLARETMKTLRLLASQGKHTGGKPPLGYDVDIATKKLILNIVEAEAIKKIFNMYANGYGYRAIVDALPGIKTKHGNKLSENAVHHILKNEKYVGTMVFNKQSSKNASGKRNGKKIKLENEIIRTENAHPPIISKEVFEMVKLKQEKNKKTAGGGSKKDNYIYLLSNLCYCGLCKGHMSGSSSVAGGKEKKKIYYYVCNRNKKYHDCGLKKINSVDLELAVIEYFKKVFTTKNINELKIWIQQNFKIILESNQKLLRKFESELKIIEGKINNVINLLIDTPSESLKEKLIGLESDKQRLKESIKLNSAKYKESPFNIEQLEKYFYELRHVEDLDRNKQKLIIGNCVDYVEVYPKTDDGKREILIKSILDQKLGIEIKNPAMLQEINARGYFGGECSHIGVSTFELNKSIVDMFICKITIISKK